MTSEWTAAVTTEPTPSRPRARAVRIAVGVIAALVATDVGLGSWENGPVARALGVPSREVLAARVHNAAALPLPRPPSSAPRARGIATCSPGLHVGVLGGRFARGLVQRLRAPRFHVPELDALAHRTGRSVA